MSEAIERALDLHQESTLLEERGEFAEAEKLCREALSIFEREEGAGSADVANLLYSIGALLERQGKFTEAPIMPGVQWRSLSLCCRTSRATRVN